MSRCDPSVPCGKIETIDTEEIPTEAKDYSREDEFNNLRTDVRKLQNIVNQLMEAKYVQLSTFDEFRASIELRLATPADNDVRGNDVREDAPAEEPVEELDEGDTMKQRENYHDGEEKVLGREHQFSYNAGDYEQAKDSWMLREQMYQFTESVWDSSFFAFVNFIKPMDSVYLVIMFFVNLGMQCCLTIFSFSPFTKEAYKEADIDDLREWRTVVAHDSRWMDSITQQSLARLVCSSAQAPYLSGSTKVAKDLLISYKPNEYYGSSASLIDMSFMGEALCLLTLVIWWFTCYIEIRSLYFCAQGILLVPFGKQTKLFMVKPGSIDDIAIHALSIPRRIWCLFVLSLRLAVALILAYMGTYFLVYTTSLRELILNAVALDLMLNVDELIYNTMAPFKVRHFISCLEPIPKIHSSCIWRGIDFDTPIIIVVIIVSMFFTLPVLEDQSDLMSRAIEEICGGYLDFVYTLDPGGAVVAYSTPVRENVRPFNSGPSGGVIVDQEQTYRWLAVRELITYPDAVTRNPANSLSDGASALSGSALGLIERPSFKLGDRMADLNPLCDDWSLSGSTLVWPVNFIQKMYPSHPIFGKGASCQDGLKYCNWDNEIGIAMRQWCSSTCGCNGANSSLILSKKISGCPNSCLDLPYYKATLSETPCVDNNSTAKVFQNYLDGMRSLRESYKRIGTWYDMFGQWIDGLQQNNCSGHNLVYGDGNFGSLCGNTAFGLKPIANICPQTCKCDSHIEMPVNQPPLCPDKCWIMHLTGDVNQLYNVSLTTAAPSR